MPTANPQSDCPAGLAKSPVFFYVSGFPKSGNKWLQRQLLGLESIGGFHLDPAKGLPLLADEILENQPLLDWLNGAGMNVEQFVCRAYGPHHGEPLECPPAMSASRDELIGRLAIQASRTSRTPMDGSLFAGVFAPADGAQRGWAGRQAIVVPGMHTPLAAVRRLLPSFRIVNLQRDPRDVVVSYFYHYIATLTQPLAEKFVNRNEVTGEIEQNPKWKRPFARRIMRSMLDYHAQRLPTADAEREHVLRVRYEDLLVDGAGELRRILQFVGCDESDAAVAQVVEANRFERVTGSQQEQRDSLVRKGRSGDWQNYFDRELLRALGEEFPAVVRDLGYEHDDAWMQQVPRHAPAQFDFARFRIKRSTTRQFAHLWSESADLRARFPNPWDVDESDSFFAWLCQCDDPDVRAWLALARRLEDLWQVNVVER